MILWFSGTGNSRYVAEKTAEITGDSLVSMNDLIKGSKRLVCKDRKLIFCTPTYAWQIPHIVCEMIAQGEYGRNADAYFLMTCGDDNGNAEKYLRKLCKNAKMNFCGCREIIMPENYIAMYDAPDNGEAKTIISKADNTIKETALLIAEGRPLPRKKYNFGDVSKSSIVNKLFVDAIVSAKKFRIKDTCTRCGRCEKLCPMNNIRITESGPVWSDRCVHCMACICYCPAEAIEYGKGSVGRNRYTLEKAMKE